MADPVIPPNEDAYDDIGFYETETEAFPSIPVTLREFTEEFTAEFT